MSLLVAQAQTGPAPSLAVIVSDPVAFVRYLAELNIPAGIELKERDEKAAGSAVRVTREFVSSQPAVEIGRLVQRFNQAQAGYFAEVRDRVVVVRPVNERSDYLDSRPLAGILEDEGLMRFTEKIFAPLDPSLDVPGGRIGIFAGSRTGIDRGETLRLLIRNADQLTVIDALNEVARQAPGHPWCVVTGGEKAQPLRYGFFHHEMTTTFKNLTLRNP